MAESYWRRLSIATKLPLFIALLMAAGLGSMAALGYWQVRTSNLEAASERLRYAAQQIADVLQTSVRQRSATMEGLRTRLGAAAAATLAQPDSPDAELLQGMTAYLGNAASSASLELWDRDGRRIRHVGAPADPLPDHFGKALIAKAASSPAWGHLEAAANGSIIYPIAIPIMDGDRAVGFFVDRRRLANAPVVVTLLSNLIGDDARLLVGNDDGSVWTDLGAATTGPAAADLQPSTYMLYNTARGAVIARAVPVAGTPWLAAVEFPQGAVLDPARQFVGFAALLAIVIAASCVALGWALSRPVTKSLQQITHAAEIIAATEYAAVPYIAVDRVDEVGRLAAAFNAMADAVDTRIKSRTAALEQANKELESFSYSVSHDLRAPLRAIDGYARMMSEDHGETLPQAARDQLAVISSRTRHMGQLIDDLLAFSRVGRQELRMGDVDMHALFRGVADEALANAPGAAQITVEPLPSAIGERQLLRQVAVNLIQNALKFSRTRPAPTIVVGAEAGKDSVTYFVKDNGVGFDMAYADKLFGVFQRLHRAEDFEGTGVGLAIVQRIVQRHGGRVWAQAGVDQGATFFFTLPPVKPTDASQH